MREPLAARERLIFALDVPTLKDVKRWVLLLKGTIGVFKIGKEIYTACGPDSVRAVHDEGGEVFLDLKFHDIPNTAAMAAMSASRLGVKMFNLHSIGGFRMMETVVKVVHKGCEAEGIERPLILAVTILTSMEDEDLAEVGIRGPVKERVSSLSILAEKAGIDGVVASPGEARSIREETREDFVVVTPGIRLPGSLPDDQRRTMTPAEAIKEGSDYIVVGRPIRDSQDPVGSVESIIAEIERMV
ncbi:MAG: orotidine-5'-phosphate decarboxylase [Thermodesulfobacteriota bacterium]